jgi:hypothetical protein
MKTPDIHLRDADFESERSGRESARDAWVEARIADRLADRDLMEDTLEFACTPAELAAWKAAIAVALESYQHPTTQAQATLRAALERVAREDVEADLRDSDA